MSNRERVRAEARRLYPTDSVKYGGHPIPRGMQYFFSARAQAAFKRGRTVTPEQVEAAAEALWNRSPFAEALEVGWDEWSRQNPDATELWKDDVRSTLTAAGLLIEGGNDE